MAIQKIKQLVPTPIKRLVYASRELSARIQLEFETLMAQVNPTPIIILGNQKSGTSAIAVLIGKMTGLSFHIDMMKANEQNIYEAVKKGQVSFAEFIKLNKLEFSKTIVKEPNLSFFYDELFEAFPDAKFVFVVRDPRCNIRSILDRFKISGNLEQMTHEDYQKLVRSWPSVFDGSWMGFQGENYIEMLAERWNYMVDSYWKNQENILLVKYEDFLQNKSGEIGRIVRALGLMPKYDISQKVDIQYQPSGQNKNMNLEKFFGLKNLDRIEKICGERMKLFDYQ